MRSRQITSACVVVVLAACSASRGDRDALLANARQARGQGQTARAEEILENLRRRDPRDREAVMELAETQRRRAAPILAYATLDSLPADVDLDIQYRVVQAHVLLDLARILPAAAVLVALDHDGAAPSELVTELVTAMAQTSVSVRDVSSLPIAWREMLVDHLMKQKLLDKAADHALALPSGSSRRATLIDRVLAEVLERQATDVLEQHPELLDPQDRPEKLLAKHTLLMSRGDWQGASEVEREMETRFPQHPIRYALVLAAAERHLAVGDASAALAAAQAAVVLAPRATEPLLARAMALDGLDRRVDAIHAYEQVLAVDPTNAAATRAIERLAPALPLGPAARFSLRIDASAAKER